LRRHRFDLGAAAIVSTIALTYVLTSQAGWRGLALHIYVVVIGALLLIGFVAEATGEHRGSAFDTALGERSDPHPAIAEVARLEREVTLSTATAQDLHLRLLPTLREIAWSRLERAGREPGPETLGRWWELLRPDREPPEDRFAPGISERDLRDLVGDLEAM
jgi:cell division protein FtsW (lipid II flippase)